MNQRVTGGRRGFTLIELIATIAVLAVLGSLASQIIFTASDGYLRAATQAQLQCEASSAMDRIVRELRIIPRRPSATDIAPHITSMTSSSIQWGTSSLMLAADQLRLNIDGTNRVLLSDVSEFDLRAFDENGQQLNATLNEAGCAAIRRLQITLAVERHGVIARVRSRVFLRCMIGDAS